MIAAAHIAIDELGEDAIINDVTDLADANSVTVVNAMVMDVAVKRNKVVRAEQAASLLNRAQVFRVLQV